MLSFIIIEKVCCSKHTVCNISRYFSLILTPVITRIIVGCCRFICIYTLTEYFIPTLIKGYPLFIVPLLASQTAAWRTLCGLTFKERAELLYCSRRYKCSLIVPVSCGSRGNEVIVFVTSAGTFTTFPVILNCLPLGACIIF